MFDELEEIESVLDDEASGEDFAEITEEDEGVDLGDPMDDKETL